jgi:NIMA (never in mitosis gene a)-related kinase
VRILASIHNPHIIGYKEAFLEAGNLWYQSDSLSIIMEYANDGDLSQKILEKKRTTRSFMEEEIWRVLIQVTQGLRALHALKIFHRDLKVTVIVICSQPMYS